MSDTEPVQTVGTREACPERGGARPHRLVSGRYGGAFCLACDKSFPRFHVHHRQVCDCRPSIRAALEDVQA